MYRWVRERHMIGIRGRNFMEAPWAGGIVLLGCVIIAMLLANLPVTGLFAEPVYDPVTHSGTVGFMWVLYQGVQYAIYPSIIFMGIGAMTDFGPLLANPMSLMLGAAAQLGIFAAFLMALVLGPITGGVISFTPADAAAIGVIGGADGPTAILTASKLSVELLPEPVFSCPL